VTDLLAYETPDFIQLDPVAVEVPHFLIQQLRTALTNADT
jgi:hypothetical protein